jgi:nucleotide-binding universal stress UspA family protein
MEKPAEAEGRANVNFLSRMVESYGERPEDVIIAAGVHLSADLLVMDTHGPTGAGRLLQGSVAESVVRTNSLPVLLVRDTPAHQKSMPPSNM